jgi:hypothetical protein
MEEFGWVGRYMGAKGDSKLYADAGRLEAGLRVHEVDALTLREFWDWYMWPNYKDDFLKGIVEPTGHPYIPGTKKDKREMPAELCEAMRRAEIAAAMRRGE